MLSSGDLERLITVKRREIEKEKILLGLIMPDHSLKNEDNKENVTRNLQDIKKPIINNYVKKCDDDSHESERDKALYEREEHIPADLERYIRRYVGLPVMLKTGEYSPNNPLLRSERDTRSGRDVFLGLGEYDERKKSLRRLRQQEYREYLDQQAKKKKEEKEKAERELRLLEERERRKLEEIERREEIQEKELKVPGEQNSLRVSYSPERFDPRQCMRRPLSVACQTEDSDFIQMPCNLTQAERELSPRTVLDGPKPHPDERPIKPAVWQDVGKEIEKNIKEVRRKSHGDFDARSPCGWRPCVSEGVKYLPSILDADAVQLRNMKSQQEASERRQFYQEELKCQIQEQQRIREERKAREKLLEMAEIRRLEEQLRMLSVATGTEHQNHQLLTNAMQENAEEYDRKQKLLLKNIDEVKHHKYEPRISTSKSDEKPHSKFPFYYKPSNQTNKPFSLNIPDNSIFSKNYDVDSYLRRNLNPTKNDENYLKTPESRKDYLDFPIPLIRHSPSYDKSEKFVPNPANTSPAMKLVEDKWKVPIVQRNIVKSQPSVDGKNINILTQLGSIRRQLQLEQLKLDKMLSKDGEV